MDFDNTIAKIKYIALIKHLPIVSLIKEFKNTCNYFRGFRLHNLEDQLEKELKHRKNTTKSVQDVDTIIENLKPCVAQH